MTAGAVPIRVPRTFVELIGGEASAGAALTRLGMTPGDGRGDRDAMLIARSRIELSGCDFRLTFSRKDLALIMHGMIGGAVLQLGSTGRLIVPARLAQNLAGASLDRPVSEIVDHAVLSAAPLIVTAAEPLATTTLFDLSSELVTLFDADQS